MPSTKARNLTPLELPAITSLDVWNFQRCIFLIPPSALATLKLPAMPLLDVRNFLLCHYWTCGTSMHDIMPTHDDKTGTSSNDTTGSGEFHYKHSAAPPRRTTGSSTDDLGNFRKQKGKGGGGHYR